MSQAAHDYDISKMLSIFDISSSKSRFFVYLEMQIIS